MALLIELNSFSLIHAFHFRSSHWLNAARQFLLAAQAAQAVPEWYEYVRSNTTRIGHNCWLLFVTVALEVVLGAQYGKGGKSYGPWIVPTDIRIIMASFLTMWTIWLAASVYMSKLNEPSPKPLWLAALRILAHIPLLFLARRWAY